MGIRYLNTVWIMAKTCSGGEPALIALQWKVLHHIYTTNDRLFKMTLRPDNLCKHCNIIDTVEHYFVECLSLNQLWTEVEKDISIGQLLVDVLG